MAADKSLKIPAEDDDELEQLCADYKAQKGWLACVLLQYGMRHAQAAIDEWNEIGAQRVKRRKSQPVRLRASSGTEE